MKKINKLYSTVIAIQLSITLSSLSVSSLGGVIKHPYLAYFWYLALIGIALIMATTLLAGLLLALSHAFHHRSSSDRARGNHDLLARPEARAKALW